MKLQPNQKSMKPKKHIIRIGLLLLTGLVAAICITTISAQFLKKSEDQCATLTRVGNCQTDVVAPFVQRYHLHTASANKSQSFRELVTQEVTAGRIPKAEAQKALSAIDAANDGMPVRTPIGWTLPTISKL